MSFPAYELYADTGDDWVGTVPSHWDVFPNKVAFQRIKTEVGSEWDSTDLLSLTLRGVVLRDIESGDGKYPSDFSNYQIVEPDDLVFCLFDMDETPRTVGLSDHRGMITGAYDVFRCTERAIPGYVYYFYRHIDAYKKLRPFYTGLRKTVRTPTFLSIKMPLPPPDEQKSISSFLDVETSKIDGLVSEQRRLIELLKEKRQAVISHAVTKGLNPNAPMKPSGIQWLGDVPQHWKRSQPKYFTTKIVDGVHFKPNYVDEGIPFVTVQNLTAGHGISFENLNYISDEDHEEYFKRANPERGDVLLTKDGATLGVARVVETDRVFSIFVSVALLKPVKEMIDPWFLAHVLESSVVFQQFKAGEKGSALKHIHLIDLRNVYVPLPPVDEQREIVRSLANQLTELDSLVSEAERAIELLQERRTAIVSAAVTGKIDVRESAFEECET